VRERVDRTSGGSAYGGSAGSPPVPPDLAQGIAKSGGVVTIS